MPSEWFPLVLGAMLLWAGFLTYFALRAKQPKGDQGLAARLVNLEAVVTNIISRPGVSAQLLSSSPEGRSGLLISRAHIAASGGFVGQPENVVSVVDTGVGQRNITWSQDYANTDYHVSITPTAGQFEIESKSVGGISIRTYRYGDLPTDIELDVFAIGDA